MSGGGKFSAFTIVTRNHFAHAKTLVKSFLKENPETDIYVLAVDGAPKKGTFPARRVKVVLLEKLLLAEPALWELVFRYDAFALCCALKPVMVEYLFQVAGEQRLLYLDSDIQVTGNLRPVADLLERHPLLLTPHLISSTALLDEVRLRNETLVLTSGTYNMGFFGISSTPQGREFLAWWKQRVAKECRNEPFRGLFVDQKWVDLVPALFPWCHIVRDPGCNVAFWNLDERQINQKKAQYHCGSVPMRFFHFSGFSPERPALLSRHGEGRHQDPNEAVLRLQREYARALNDNGVKALSKIAYRFDRFDNGMKIPPFVRELYGRLTGATVGFGNPFETRGENSFFNWLITPRMGLVPPIVVEMRNLRKDVVDSFPYPSDVRDQLKLLAWVNQHGVKEFELDQKWQELLRFAELMAHGKASAGAKEKRESKPSEPVRPGLGFGVNLIGSVESEKGMGASVRGSRDALEAAGIPYVLNNVEDRRSSNVVRVKGLDGNDRFPFDINLVHLNPDGLPSLSEGDRLRFLKSRINVGYWTWEFPEFPEHYSRWFRLFHEIWVPSTFVQRALSRISPVPVVCVPHSLSHFERKGGAAVAHLKSGDTARKDFTFLFAFDFDSSYLRKNPEGVISSFQRAFPRSGDAAVRLIIKSSRGELHPKHFERLKKLAGGDPRIVLLSKVLNAESTRSLMETADCYVSLHRSEGFGLTLLEAMCLGKPVVATGFSGNLDFMTVRNSYLVPFTLSTVREPFGPYVVGSTWAEPDVEEAARMMAQVYRNPAEAKDRGITAARDIRERFGLASISAIYSERLRALARRQAMDA